jgi:hypothetical protein
MKILITEKQAKKLFGEKIKCKCGHSWVIEKDDNNPHLCHICGWNGKLEKYEDNKLLDWWKKKLKNEDNN